MGTLTISPKVYGGLLSKTLPKVIETDRELEHFADALEALDRLDRELKPEEKLLEALLSRLIADYAIAAAQDHRVSHGAARVETGGFAACVRIAERGVGCVERQTGAEQEPHSQTGGVLQAVAGSVFLNGSAQLVFQPFMPS